MYHIKEDKRAKKSAELVVKALDECLEATNFEDLTITEICNVSTIGRATFYRLFDDLEDVLAYKCELFADEFTVEVQEHSLEEIQIKFFTKWMNMIEFLKLIVSLRRTDILFDCHRNHIDSMKREFKLIEPADDITDYHIVMLTNILVGALMVWCEHDCKESPEELVKAVRKSIVGLSKIFEKK